MAKKPVLRNRFRLIVETSEEAMGPVLAHLTRMGLENVAYELITDVRTYGNNKKEVVPRAPRAAISGRDRVLQSLDGRDKFTVKEIAKVLEDHGLNRVSASPLITNLAKDKFVKNIGKGEYQVMKSGQTLAHQTAQRLASPNPSMNGSHAATETAHG